MKVALIIYGHMRTYQIAFPGLEEFFLSTYQPDVFMHTWDEVEARTKSWHRDHMRIRPLDVSRVIEMYDPKNILVEKQPQVDDDRVTPNNNISYVGQKFMLESLYKADSLRRESGVDYDIVVKIRPDIRLLKPLPVPEPTPGIVFTGSNPQGGKRSACDIINIATAADMEKVCQVHAHFDEFYVDRYNRGILEHSGFIDYIRSLDLEISWMPYLYKNHWNIVRRRNG